MENKNDFNEERFDSYLNKTIILSSKDYFRKQISLSNKERTIVDDEDYSVFLQGITMLNGAFSTIDNITNTLELKNAMKSPTAR